MTGVGGSSLQPWLDFNGDNLPEIIPACQVEKMNQSGITTTDCTATCNATVALLDPSMPNNLLTCGLFASLTLLNQYTLTRNPLGTYNDSHAFYVPLLARFNDVGLNSTDQDYGFVARNAVSAAMTWLQQITKIQTYRGNLLLEGACSEQALFPYALPSFNPDLPRHLRDCVDAICAPRTLDPDLGGIGVFVSLLTQICLAATVFIALTFFTFWPRSKRKGSEKQLLNLATALVEFHKAQCYFISAIEIAVLVLSHQVYEAYKNSQNGIPKAFDLLLSFPLSMNGFVPITFSLLCISLHSRLTWHIILLLLVPIALSTGALGSSFTWTLKLQNLYGDGLINQTGNYPDYLSVAESICGSRSGNLKHALNRSSIRAGLIWAIYAFCIASFACCVAMHAMSDRPKGSRGEKIRSSLKTMANKPSYNRLLLLIGYPVLHLLWLLCFIYHLYLYSLFTQSHFVSSEWTFGQIIAVSVWAPSIVEFLYIEWMGVEDASKYRYPPGVKAFRYKDPAVSQKPEAVQLLPLSRPEPSSNPNPDEEPESAPSPQHPPPPTETNQTA